MFRLTATGTGDLSTGNTNIFTYLLNNSGTQSYTGDGTSGVYIYGAQLEESSSAGNYILTDGAAAIDVTTIQNPTNKGYDILGNALRLREHAFNLDGSGYAEVAISSSITNVTNGTLQFWLKNTKTTTFVIFNESNTTNYLGAWNGSGNFYNDSASGTITQYADNNSTVTSAKITDGTWHLYTFTGIDLSSFDELEISNYSSTPSIWLDCIIDEVVVYDRVLTSKEITQNYKAGINKHKASSSFSDDFSSDYGI